MVCIEKNVADFNHMIRVEISKYQRKTVNGLGHVTILPHEYLKEQAIQFYSVTAVWVDRVNITVTVNICPEPVSPTRLSW